MSKNKSKLFDLGEDSDCEDGSELKINTNYAERYNKWRGSEELQKLKDRYGENPDEDEESSSSSSEEEWTAENEKDFFKTYALLKKKDPKIYDSKLSFFKKEGPEDVASSSATTEKRKKKTKNEKITLKDHERKMILEKGSLESDSEDEDERSKRIKIEKAGEPTYVQEQERIKKGFSEALKGIDSEDEGDDYQKSDLLKRRKKTEDEEKEEAEDYRKWLKGESNKLDSSKGANSEELKFLRGFWNDPKLNDDEKFLRDYVLNRGYEEKNDETRIPSYDEIVHDSDEGGLSGDEEELNKMETFEHKYNFRFEEPDQEFIKRYPRTVESSLRRTEGKRKLQRDERKERKEAEKTKKRDEIQRLKAMKRKEILEKLEQIEQITGDEHLAFRDEDIEGDFDPSAHDRRMEQIFNEKYYEVAGDEEKPVFPYDEELDAEDFAPFCPSDEEETSQDNNVNSPSKSTKENTTKTVAEASSSKMSKPSKLGNTSTSVINELIESSRGKRQNKKKSSIFLEALERHKPKFEATGRKSFQEYFDEYYKLDFEDLIGDIPCRFKYRNVTPNDFGLSIEEVLQAPDRELNQWASLKKTYQYRSTEEEKYELDAYRKKAANEKLKRKILPTIFAPVHDEDDNSDEVDTVKTAEENGDKKKKKRRRKKKKNSSVPVEDEEPIPIESETNSEPPVIKKKKERKTRVLQYPQPIDNSSSKDDQQQQQTQEENPSSTNNKKEKKGKKRKFDQSTLSRNKKDKELAIDDDRLKAYGINPKKYKKQLKYGNKT